MDFEIEEPTEEQRLEAVLGQAVRMASRAEWDTAIIAYLVTQKMSKSEAIKHLPGIRERARPLMNRHFGRKRMIGWLLIITAIGIAAVSIFQETGLSVPGLILSVIPLFAGINHIFKSRTPDDSELGLSEPE